MIVIRVEQWSAVTGNVTELARMHICNDGSLTPRSGLGNYDVSTFRGRAAAALAARRVQRKGRVERYPRRDLHVWNLVGRALRAMGYDAP